MKSFDDFEPGTGVIVHYMYIYFFIILILALGY